MANREKRIDEEVNRARWLTHFSTTLYEAKTKHRNQKGPKRKSNTELFESLNLHRFDPVRMIRLLDHFTTKHYNLERQQRALLDYLFVRYPVPNFLYLNFWSKNPQAYAFDWFFCIAQGGSFQKLTRDIMTKKECVIFLNSPLHDMAYLSVWYAKLKIHGLSAKIINGLLFRKQLFPEEVTPQTIENYAHVINFFVKYHTEIDDHVFDEITDYIGHQMRHNATFSLTGRTLNSVIVLSNEWHGAMQKAKLGRVVQWDAKYSPWVRDEKEYFWEIIELTTNNDLLKEGKKQKHCVSAYTSRCEGGGTQILSLRRYDSGVLRELEKSRITIEVRGNSIVQMRGLMNRKPNNEETRIINKFASEKFLIINSKNGW